MALIQIVTAKVQSSDVSNLWTEKQMVPSYLGFTIPGVSWIMIFADWCITCASLVCWVVFVLLETADTYNSMDNSHVINICFKNISLSYSWHPLTFLPTKALSKVDFPAFGAPSKAALTNSWVQSNLLRYALKSRRVDISNTLYFTQEPFKVS